jgi:hypothetical protein
MLCVTLSKVSQSLWFYLLVDINMKNCEDIQGYTTGKDNEIQYYISVDK